MDAGKQEIAENYGLPMLEIDLSGYVEAGISRGDLSKLLTESTEHKKWICFSKELVDNTRNDLMGQAIAIQKHLEELDVKRKEYFLPNNYSSTLSTNRSDRAFDGYAKQALHFHDQTDHFVVIGGQRWVLCTSCKKPIRDADMVMIGFPTMNKGRCRDCCKQKG